ncbi:MAG: hypothetical protein QM632_03990 [Micrococcaceae bacterium]
MTKISNEKFNISRRNITKSTAWSIPVVAVAIATPMAAASDAYYTLTPVGSVTFDGNDVQQICWTVGVVGTPADVTVTFSSDDADHLSAVLPGQATLTSTTTQVCVDYTSSPDTATITANATATFDACSLCTITPTSVTITPDSGINPAPWTGSWSAASRTAADTYYGSNTLTVGTTVSFSFNVTGSGSHSTIPATQGYVSVGTLASNCGNAITLNAPSTAVPSSLNLPNSAQRMTYPVVSGVVSGSFTVNSTCTTTNGLILYGPTPNVSSTSTQYAAAYNGAGKQLWWNRPGTARFIEYTNGNFGSPGRNMRYGRILS